MSVSRSFASFLARPALATCDAYVLPLEPALTEDEAEMRAIERHPTASHNLELASVEADGSIILWNGSGDGVLVMPADQEALMALMQGLKRYERIAAFVHREVEFHTTAETTRASCERLVQ